MNEMQSLLYQEASKCLYMVECAGIQHGNITGFSVNTRAKRRWGQCKYDASENGYKINISCELLSGNCNDGLENTIIHEILHTCKGCMNHGSEWKRLAEIIYRTYGIEIKRCSSAAEKGVDEEEHYRRIREARASRKKEEYRYIFRCSCCGCLYGQKRASKFTKHPETYHCARCGGKFVKISA